MCVKESVLNGRKAGVGGWLAVFFFILVFLDGLFDNFKVI